jgi:hypothetical protein
MLLGGIVHAEKNSELSAPSDVAASNWLPLGDFFGIVIVKAGKTTKPNNRTTSFVWLLHGQTRRRVV